VRKLNLLFLALSVAAGADFPEARISSGTLDAKLYLPDAEKGYYRGTRFDWSGVIYSLRYRGTSISGSGSSATIRNCTTRSWGLSKSF
jgi:hypothetical protein